MPKLLISACLSQYSVKQIPLYFPVKYLTIGHSGSKHPNEKGKLCVIIVRGAAR